MIKRCIGIDIGRSYLRAVQIMRTDDELCIEKVFTTPTRRSQDSPPEILRRLSSQHGFDGRADVAITMPHDSVFFRNLETDFAGLQQNRQLTESALEYNFPIELDEIVAQVCSWRRLPGDKYSALTAAVTRASLRERLNILAEAKMQPNRVEAAIFAIHSTVAANHPEIATGQAMIAYIDESCLTLAVTEDNNIMIVRSIPIVSHSENNNDSAQKLVAELLVREAEVTWRKVFGEEIEQDSMIYLAAAGQVPDDIIATVEKKLRSQTVIVEPYAGVECLPEHKGDTAICVAEGLALRALAPDKTVGINFLEVDNVDTKPTLDLKKEFVICVILAAAIAFVSLIGLYLRLSYLENKNANTKNEIRKIFQRTVPEETNIVNPLAQLEQKLESFRNNYSLFASFSPTNLSPLKVLHSITASTPSKGDIKIDDLLITAKSVRLRGTCNSFESVYQWQRLLQEIPGFRLVDVQDVQKAPKGDAIHFTILISSAGSSVVQERR